MPTIFRHKVAIGTAVFNDGSVRPIGAQEWGIDVLEGWKTSPELTVRSTELGGENDGEVLGSYFPLRGRHLIVGGYVLAATEEEAEELHDALLRDAVPRNKDILLTRYESVPKFLRVRREGAVETTWPLPNGFRWSAALIAPDPLKYAVDQTIGSGGVVGVGSGGRRYPRRYPLRYATAIASTDAGVVLTNEGTAPTSPVATLFGPLGRGVWWLVNETVNEELRFDVGLVAGDTLEIDFREEVALLNGFPVSATVTGDFWKVVPGPNRIKLYAEEAPGAGFSITIYSAWE